MDKLSTFSNTKNFGLVKLKRIIDENSSIGGALKKWTFIKDDYKYYVKTFSKSSSGFDCYECENECFVSELFSLLGLPNVKYYLDEIVYGGVNYKVCISKDYAHGMSQITLFECVPGVFETKGKERYDDIVNYLPSIQEQLDKILIGDFIINNRDRHLHNLEIVVNSSGEILLPCYDNGSSLFYNVRDKSLKLFYKLSWETSSCKPFYSSWGKQLSLVNLKNYSLNNVTPEEIRSLLVKYYSNKRSSLLLEFILSRLQILKDKGVNFI